MLRKITPFRKERSGRRLLIFIFAAVIIYYGFPAQHIESRKRKENKLDSIKDDYILIGKEPALGPIESSGSEGKNQLKHETEIPDHLLSSIGSAAVGGEDKFSQEPSQEDNDKKAKNAENLNDKVFR